MWAQISANSAQTSARCASPIAWPKADPVGVNAGKSIVPNSFTFQLRDDALAQPNRGTTINAV